jgi:hypothetical protein
MIDMGTVSRHCSYTVPGEPSGYTHFGYFTDSFTWAPGECMRACTKCG